MSDKPLVSVMIPAFNAQETIRSTLESVWRQSYRPIEVIIINDGSTDHTLDVIESWVSEKEARDFTIQIVYQENQGLLGSRERGFESSKGEYLQFLDADDLLHVDKLARCVPFLESGEWDVVVPRTDKFRSDDEVAKRLGDPATTREWTTSELHNSSITSNYWHSIGPLVSRPVVNLIGGFRRKVDPYAEELDFHGRIKLTTQRVRYLDEVLNFYRKGNPNSLTGTRQKTYEGRVESARVALELLKEFRVSDRREWNSLVSMCVRTYYQSCVMTNDRSLQRRAKESLQEVLRHRSRIALALVTLSSPCACLALRTVHQLRHWMS